MFLHLSDILFTGGLVSQHASQVTWPCGSASREGLHPGGRPPPDPSDIRAYGQQTGGTYPTEMHSCFNFLHSEVMRMLKHCFSARATQWNYHDLIFVDCSWHSYIFQMRFQWQGLCRLELGYWKLDLRTRAVLTERLCTRMCLQSSRVTTSSKRYSQTSLLRSLIWTVTLRFTKAKNGDMSYWG